MSYVKKINKLQEDGTYVAYQIDATRLNGKEASAYQLKPTVSTWYLGPTSISLTTTSGGRSSSEINLRDTPTAGSTLRFYIANTSSSTYAQYTTVVFDMIVTSNISSSGVGGMSAMPISNGAWNGFIFARLTTGSYCEVGTYCISNDPGAPAGTRTFYLQRVEMIT